MQVEFLLLDREATASDLQFFRCCGWPLNAPEEGWMVSFGAVNGDAKEVTLRGKVAHVDQPQEGRIRVWMDMGMSTEALQGKEYLVRRWKETIHHPESA